MLTIMFVILIISGLFLLFAEGLPTLRRHVRVIGGEPVDITNYPYQVSVRVNGLHICGGSIISEKFVITAAHCVDGDGIEEVTVQAGTSLLKDDTKHIHNVIKISEHPNFSLWNYENDIAILKLTPELTFNDKINSIKLPDSEDDVPIPGTMASITGWGAEVERSNDFSNKLLRAEVPILSLYECLKDYPFDGITENMICAGFKDGKHDTCIGDSGGALAVDKTLIGITSWGYACGKGGHPGVYTSAVGVRDFIKEITGL